MSDGPIVPSPAKEPAANPAAVVPAEYIAAQELEKLPPEMKTVVSVMAAFIRNSSGPDAETAKIVAETERHEESCKLEGFKETLKTRDLQNERDHKYRVKKLNHDTARNMVVTLVAVAGIITGLYLLVAKNDSAVGTPILVASFMALVGGKSLFPKDKE